MVELDEKDLNEYYKICEDFMKKCGIELEYDIIEKIYQKDVNNYCCIINNGKYKMIKSKGGYFSAVPDIKINDDGTLETKYEPSFTQNSLSIVAESVIKLLLFDIPIEETINNCNELMRFQMISKVGRTYQKCVLETKDGDIDIQKTNRLYSGKIKTGKIVKIKSDGRRDSLANCPPNVIIDNKNEITIEELNKEWYIKVAKQRVEDFYGSGKQILAERRKLMKKDELIELTKKQEEEIKNLEKVIEENMFGTKEKECKCKGETMNNKKELLEKINKFRTLVRERKFILDSELPKNLGGSEYYSIGQYYDAVQELCIEVGLDFSFETVELMKYVQDNFKPSTGNNQHLAIVKCIATLTDLDTGDSKSYTSIGGGSDSNDKSVSGASTTAFRKWFAYNFTPKDMFDDDNAQDTAKTVTKTPKFVPDTKKQEIAKKVVAEVTPSTNEDDKRLIDNIMKVRELTGEPSYGEPTYNKVINKQMSASEITAAILKTELKLEGLK